MYSYLKGEITEINASHITIEAGGVGYMVHVANPFDYIENSKELIYIHYFQSEDKTVLYGFKDKNQKEIFLKLISVKGLGPKGALSVLASATPDEIISEVDNSNASFFIKFPGIGQKLSQQIILDLKGKIKLIDNSLQTDERLKQISMALKALGYQQSEIKNVIKNINLDKETTISDALKIALKMIRS